MFESCNSSMGFWREFKLEASMGEGTLCLVKLLLLEAAAGAGLSKSVCCQRNSKGQTKAEEAAVPDVHEAP